MAATYDPREKLVDYRTYLVKKVLRLKRLLDTSYGKDLEGTLCTLRDLEAELFKLRNVGTLIELKKAA